MSTWLNGSIQTQFRTVEGLSIRFAESGRGDDHALLLSPWPESLFAFEPTWLRLAEHAHLVAIDLPGLGHSQRSDALLSPRTMGEFVVRAADAFGLERPHVVGPDVGTGASLFAAALHPDRFRSLVVGSGGAAFPLQLAGVLEEWVEARDLEPYRSADPREIVGAALTADIERYALPDHVREDYLSSYEGDRFVESMRYVRSYPTELPILRDLLPGIQTPVQIIAGARDPVVPPANAEYLHARLPNSKLDIIDTGHFTWEDGADEYAALVTSWWGGGYATNEPAMAAPARRLAEPPRNSQPRADGLLRRRRRPGSPRLRCRDQRRHERSALRLRLRGRRRHRATHQAPDLPAHPRRSVARRAPHRLDRAQRGRVHRDRGEPARGVGRRTMAEDPFDSDAAFPRLGEEVLALLEAAGERRPLLTGEILFGAGDRASAFFVVLRGAVAIIDGFGSPAERVIGVHRDRRFVGELNLVTGQPAYFTAVVREPGDAIVLSRDELQAVVSANQQLGDVIVNAFIARRGRLIGLGSGLRLIGSHLAPDSRRLREFLTRNRIPHRFVDLETDSQAELLLRWLSIAPRETPLLLHGSLALRNPSNSEVAEALNLRAATASRELCDVVVVGAGPAGLGAAVYAASEGLSTVLVDAVALGGQASTSARIENYLGFPAGISGSDLAERAAVQASRFGARSAVPETASALSFEDGHHVVELDRGERLRARSVVLATGASYRRLSVENLAEFEGAGVYYAATQVEAQMCGGNPVVVVGGGNSAGQAAIFLAEHVSQVHLVVRGGDLAAGMSRYLVDQVEASPGIELHLQAELRALLGDGALEAVKLHDTRAGATRTLAVTAAFVFIGADPHTGWLLDTLVTDDDGFLVTGDELQLTHLDPAGDGRERAPFPLETSRPGVFAVGDVRSGSIKRVASAVGEGAMAVLMVHRYLALLRTPSLDPAR